MMFRLSQSTTRFASAQAITWAGRNQVDHGALFVSEEAALANACHRMEQMALATGVRITSEDDLRATRTPRGTAILCDKLGIKFFIQEK